MGKHHTEEEIKKAVDLYIQYGFRASAVRAALGYPEQHVLKNWYNFYKETGTYKKPYERSPEYTYSNRWTNKEVEAAVEHYIQTGKNLRYTVKCMGYPNRPATLKEWIDKIAPEDRRIVVNTGTQNRYNFSDKIAAIAEYTNNDSEKTVQEIADEHNVSRLCIYSQIQALEKQGYNIPRMEKDTKKKVEKTPVSLDELTQDYAKLLEENKRLSKLNNKLKMENDILLKASELLKKAESINIEVLSNREKTLIVDALKDKYPVKDLLVTICLPRSSYFYQKKAMAYDKYEDTRILLKDIFESTRQCYGSRRLHAVLKQSGKCISEKVVRRLMKEESLVVKRTRKRKYSSYAGEITPAVENLLERDFHAPNPNEKWLTDITEFSLPKGKVYLSPIIDCFDGMVVSWTLGTSPCAELVNTMLKEAIATLDVDEHPIVHSDRGCHYRWPGWIEIMDNNHLIRSMSKKGCSPDNSACEGFFGRLKNEMFYGRSWGDISQESFITEVNEYIEWYNQERIKLSLGGLSPLDYRRKLGLIS